MSVKIIATDLDGTLMAPDHITVLPRTKAALKAAHDKGVKITIATGRTLSAVSNVLEQLPFVDYIIYSNGAAVYDRRKKANIYTNYISKSAVEVIVDFFEKYPVFYEIYSNGAQHAQIDKALYFKNKDLPQEFLDEYIKNIHNHKSIRKFAQNHDVEKINLYYFDGKYLEEIKNYIFSLDFIDRTSPVSGDIEMTNAGVNKGRALEGICKELGFSANEVMAFGDADNDIQMLQYAEYGFAMENADDICKSAAKYITLSNANDGIAAAIEKYILKKKKTKILVSACLLGENCKYNGSNNYNEEVEKLGEKFELIPICPEVFGGLKIPREPNEIIAGRAISKSGKDFTAEYIDGAEKTLYVANECGCRYAVMKAKSPSCGFKRIYDGTFSGTLTYGNGITADLLYNNGIKIFGEGEINKLLDEIQC